jgi:DNA polymerase V
MTPMKYLGNISKVSNCDQTLSDSPGIIVLRSMTERLAATMLTVFLTTNEFKDGPQYRNTFTLKLPVVTDNTSELIRYALQEIRAIYRERYLYKKAGVMLTGLVPASQIQADLFDDQDHRKSKRLMSALDAVNDRWGAGTLYYASSGFTKAWRTQFHRRSPAYTTNWDALPVVNA